MSTTNSYVFCVPTDKYFLCVGVYCVSCFRRLMVKPVFLQVITSCNLYFIMASVNLSSNVTRSWLLGYKFLVLSCSEFMISYILFNVGCLVKVSLKLCFGDFDHGSNFLIPRVVRMIFHRRFHQIFVFYMG